MYVYNVYNIRLARKPGSVIDKNNLQGLRAVVNLRPMGAGTQALPDLSREEIRTMLHLPDTDLKETRFYREAFAEGEAKGELALVLRSLHRRLV